MSYGTGKGISLNNKLWFHPDTQPEDNISVNQLLDDSDNWNRTAISQYYNETITATIMDIPVSKTDIEDRLVWKKSDNGIYNVRKEYQSLTKEDLPSSHDWDAFWKLPCIPKILLFGWKCLNNSLPLGANLFVKKFSIDGSCAFGCDVAEDDDHLFIHCPFARRTWMGSTLGIRTNTIAPNGFREWLTSLICNFDHHGTKENAFIQIIAFAWAIYNHRNEVKFQNKSISSENIWNTWSSMVQQCHQLTKMKKPIHNRAPTSPRNPPPIINAPNSGNRQVFFAWTKDK